MSAQWALREPGWAELSDEGTSPRKAPPPLRGILAATVPLSTPLRDVLLFRCPRHPPNDSSTQKWTSSSFTTQWQGHTNRRVVQTQFQSNHNKCIILFGVIYTVSPTVQPPQPSRIHPPPSPSPVDIFSHLSMSVSALQLFHMSVVETRLASEPRRHGWFWALPLNDFVRTSPLSPLTLGNFITLCHS